MFTRLMHHFFTFSIHHGHEPDHRPKQTGNTKMSKSHKYLIDNHYIKEIIDFKEKKVFKGISVYCCITVFTKSKKEYITYNSKPSLEIAW